MDSVGLEDMRDFVGLEDLVGVCQVLQECQAIDSVDFVDGVCPDLLDNLQVIFQRNVSF